MTRHVALVLLVPVAFFLQASTRPEAPVHLDDAQQPIELIFSHQFHVDDMELLCEDCHADVEASTTGRDNLLPPMETCGDCHDVEDLDNCGLCHSNEDDPREVPRIDTYSPPFSHERHLTSGLECASCHAEVAQQTTAAPESLPAMVECMDCHEDRGVVQECSTCHLPTERLTPDSHTPDFVHTHSDLARHADLAAEGEDKTCQTCHDDDFCQDCHQGDNLDRFTHPLNYAFTHALDAQANEQACVACHTDTEFCIDCHRDEQVLPHTHRPGWVNNIPGDGGRHRIEALNDLQSCIACHESNADLTCQPCHGGFN